MNKLIDGEIYDGETGELLNEVEQVEVEIVENELPAIVCNGGTHIVTNTEQLKKELIIHLEKYDIEVTQETEKDASKMATELNKLAKDLNSKRLSVGKEIKKPAELLKDSIDELIKIVQNKRTVILEGVEVFKSKRFEIIRCLLNQERDRLFEEMKVSEGYQFLDIECLVKETSLGKSNLTKVAKETLQSMVRGIKSIEDAVTIRTLQLEKTCEDSGLECLIELSEVESFIKESDYDERLNTMIENQLSVEQRIRENAEKEAAKKLQFEKNEAIRKENERKQNEETAKRENEERQEREIARVNREAADKIAKAQKEIDDKEAARLKKIQDEKDEIQEQLDKKEREKIAQEKATGKKTVRVVATFLVEVDVNVEDQNILDKYEDKLKGIFTTLTSVTPL